MPHSRCAIARSSSSCSRRSPFDRNAWRGDNAKSAHVTPSALVPAGVLGVVVVMTGAAGCLSDSRIPANADVTCETNDDCPRNYVCEAKRCEDPHGNLPPLITVTAPARASGDVDVDATLIDPNADTLTLTAELRIGNNAVPLVVTPAHAKASAKGTKVALTLRAPAQSSLGAGPFPVDATLRVEASDASRTAFADAPISYGNDAPQIDALSVDTVSAFQDAEPFASGVVNVRFVAQDSSADPIDVTKMRVLKDDGSAIDVPLDVHSFPNGGLSHIATSSSGSQAVLVWDTAPAAPLNEHITVELTVADGFGGSSTATTARFLLDNAPTVGVPDVLGSTGTGHPLTELRLAVPINDPNCASGDETVSLAALFGLGGATPSLPATPTADSNALTGIVATESLHFFGWDLTADALAGTLPANVIATTAHPEGELVPAQSEVALNFTVTDTAGLSRSVTTPFSVGNDPPVVTIAPFSGVQGGAVPITFSLSDTGSDPANVEIEFRKDANDTFRPIAVSAGVLDDLFTAPTASTFVVVWNSLASPNDADTTAPQGIGHLLLPNAELRIRASDEPVARERHFSPWTTIALSLSNQTAPHLEPVLVGDQGGLRNGIVPIVFRVVDEESDTVDVAFEFSLDGARFHACTEAPFAQSEGTLGLASEPESAGGVVHTFLWDSSADLMSAQPSVRLRARVVDGQAVKSTDDPATIPTVFLLQPSPFDPAPASATGSFSLRFSAGPAGFPFFGAPDVDHDGKADLVGASSGSFFVEHGNGDGTFTTVINRADTGDQPIVVDVDGDGTADAFMTSTFRLLRGPAFNDAPSLFTCPANNACSAAVADVDGDGVTDVVVGVGTGTTSTLHVLQGVGAGAAWHVVDNGAQAAGSFVAPLIADFDGDGHLDFGVFDARTSLSIARGTGQGASLSFAPLGSTVALPGLADDLVVASDVDGDGIADLFVNDQQTGVLHLLHGNGDATFTEIDSVDSVTFAAGAVADYNGDGTPDLALATATEQSILIALVSPGGAGFLGSQHLDVGRVQFSPAAGDFDGDGRPDVAAFLIDFSGNGIPNQFAVALTGTTPRPTAASASAARAMTSGVVTQETPFALDADRDGAVDFFVTTEFGDVSIARGANDGAVTTSWSTQYGAPNGDPHTETRPTIVTDLDHDGVADIAVLARIGNTSNCELQVWRADKDVDGIGTGTFTQVPFASPTSACEGMAAGDLDGDGNVDLIITNFTATLAVLHGNGDGTFAASTANAGVAAAGVVVFDMNGDGLDDVLVAADASSAGATSSPAAVLTGLGAPPFVSAPSTFTIPFGGSTLIPGDFDDDGVQDVLAVPFITQATSDCAILHGIAVAPGGAPAFNAQRCNTVLPAGQPHSPVVADFDLDGALDLAFVMPDPFPTNIFVFPGSHAGDRATGSLTASVQLASNKNRTVLTSVDVTSDGVPDFVSGTFFGGNLDSFIGRVSLPFTAFSRAISSTRVSGAAPSGADVEFVDDAGGGFTHPSSIAFRRVSGASDVLAGVPASTGLSASGDLASLLRAQRILTGPARVLTGAFYAGGDVKLARVSDPVDANSTRLELVHRLGALVPATTTTTTLPTLERAGLSLTSANANGVIVDVPFLQGRTASGNVRVLLGVPRWRTADQVASDPLSTAPNASQFLPKRAGKDVVDVRYDWLDVPAGSIATGSGKRFEIDSIHHRVRVLTDELGVIQVFDGT